MADSNYFILVHRTHWIDMKTPRKTKLIRDGYINIIPSKDWIRIGRKRHMVELRRKLQEEVDELKDSDYLSIEEYADIIEVLKCLAFFHNVDWSDIEDCRYTKMLKYGKFMEGILLVNILDKPNKEKKDD